MVPVPNRDTVFLTKAGCSPDAAGFRNLPRLSRLMIIPYPETDFKST
jgi:hypothetical protein